MKSLKLGIVAGIAAVYSLAAAPAFALHGPVVATHIGTGGCFYFQIAGNPTYYGFRVDGTQVIAGLSLNVTAADSMMQALYDNKLIGQPVGFDVITPAPDTTEVTCAPAVGLPEVTVQVITNVNVPPTPGQ